MAKEKKEKEKKAQEELKIQEEAKKKEAEEKAKQNKDEKLDMAKKAIEKAKGIAEEPVLEKEEPKKEDKQDVDEAPSEENKVVDEKDADDEPKSVIPVAEKKPEPKQEDEPKEEEVSFSPQLLARAVKNGVSITEAKATFKTQESLVEFLEQVESKGVDEAPSDNFGLDPDEVAPEIVDAFKKLSQSSKDEIQATKKELEEMKKLVNDFKSMTQTREQAAQKEQAIQFASWIDSKANEIAKDNPEIKEIIGEGTYESLSQNNEKAIDVRGRIAHMVEVIADNNRSLNLKQSDDEIFNHAASLVLGKSFKTNNKGTNPTRISEPTTREIKETKSIREEKLEAVRKMMTKAKNK